MLTVAVDPHCPDTADSTTAFDPLCETEMGPVMQQQASWSH